MSGWLSFLALAGILSAGLWWIVRPSRGLLMALGATVLVAAAGYEWLGRPDLPGQAAEQRQRTAVAANGFTEERSAWIEQVGPDPQLLAAADVFIRNGDADYAVGILRGAISREPRSAVLWMGLGNALVRFADGAVTPPARYAFERAAMLAPGNAAPGYFLGYALAEAGDLEGATAVWRQLSPIAADATHRRLIQRNLAVAQRIRVLAAAQR